jgi:hypothetical protein
MDNEAFAGAIRRRIQIPEPHIYNGLRCTCMHKPNSFRSLWISCSTLFTFRSTENHYSQPNTTRMDEIMSKCKVQSTVRSFKL